MQVRLVRLWRCLTHQAPPALPPAAVGTWTPAGDQFFARELLHDMDWRDMADLSSKRWGARGPAACCKQCSCCQP